VPNSADLIFCQNIVVCDIAGTIIYGHNFSFAFLVKVKRVNQQTIQKCILFETGSFPFFNGAVNFGPKDFHHK